MASNKAPITIESIATAAAASLDDRKSKLAFAKDVARSRELGTKDEDFATVLRAARVLRVYPDATADEIEVLGKDFEMSASKVSNYGTTLGQLTEAKAPITEDTFGDWFKLTTKPGTAKLRKSLIEEISASDASQDGKAAVIKAAAKAYVRTPVVRDKALTVEQVEAFLAKVADQDWGADAETVSDMLFATGGTLIGVDQPVDAETVDA
jgi:hypothetical protein